MSRRPDHFQKIVAEPMALLCPEEDRSLTIAAATYTITTDMEWMAKLLEEYEKHPEISTKPELEKDRRFWKKKGKIYMPPTAAPELIKGIHESLLHRHPGITKTIQKLTREYYIPGLRKKVKETLQCCEICAKTKAV